VNDKRTERPVDIHLRPRAGGGEVNLVVSGNWIFLKLVGEKASGR
jgi:hypothetical protein